MRGKRIQNLLVREPIVPSWATLCSFRTRVRLECTALRLNLHLTRNIHLLLPDVHLPRIANDDLLPIASQVT